MTELPIRCVVAQVVNHAELGCVLCGDGGETIELAFVEEGSSEVDWPDYTRVGLMSEINYRYLYFRFHPKCLIERLRKADPA